MGNNQTERVERIGSKRKRDKEDKLIPEAKCLRLFTKYLNLILKRQPNSLKTSHQLNRKPPPEKHKVSMITYFKI